AERRRNPGKAPPPNPTLPPVAVLTRAGEQRRSGWIFGSSRPDAQRKERTPTTADMRRPPPGLQSQRQGLTTEAAGPSRWVSRTLACACTPKPALRATATRTGPTAPAGRSATTRATRPHLHRAHRGPTISWRQSPANSLAPAISARRLTDLLP